MEFGPYVYQEYDIYTELNWTTATNPATGNQVNAVEAIYNEYTEFVSDGDG